MQIIGRVTTNLDANVRLSSLNVATMFTSSAVDSLVCLYDVSL